MLKKVVIIGPESTGKSTLSRQLAAHFDTRWCPEYAREYLMTHGTAYSYDQLLDIAHGQVETEDHYTQMLSEAGMSLLIVDTDMYVMKVWCEYVFQDCHTWILNQAARRHYDLYLLCRPDLPWVRDELREYPEEKPRQELYHIYRDIMVNQSTPWVDIGGGYAERLQQAVKAVEELCGHAP